MATVTSSNLRHKKKLVTKWNKELKRLRNKKNHNDLHKRQLASQVQSKRDKLVNQIENYYANLIPKRKLQNPDIKMNREQVEALGKNKNNNNSKQDIRNKLQNNKNKLGNKNQDSNIENNNNNENGDLDLTLDTEIEEAEKSTKTQSFERAQLDSEGDSSYQTELESESSKANSNSTERPFEDYDETFQLTNKDRTNYISYRGPKSLAEFQFQIENKLRKELAYKLRKQQQLHRQKMVQNKKEYENQHNKIIAELENNYKNELNRRNNGQPQVMKMV